ncbi:MAG: ribose 5-phosphate isomerase B [bacterium]|nr:ribose 5-phosphate isomerase B [bacterium]
MKIAIGSDHAGYELKAHLAAWLEKNGYEVHDLGTGDAEARAGSPECGEAVGGEVAEGKADKGIVVCGSGIGISIAANKVNGIRAALVHDPESAIMSRRHNDANVLALSGRPFSREKAENAEKTAKAWLETAFDGGRHAVRVQMLSDIEKRQ